MIEQLNRKSLYIGGLGLTFQMIGTILLVYYPIEILCIILLAIGSILLIKGVLLHLQAKGRHWAWVFFLPLEVFGLLIIYNLKDYYENEEK